KTGLRQFLDNVRTLGKADHCCLRGKVQILEFERDHAIDQFLETIHVLGDVVVGTKNVARTAAIRVLDIGEHACQRILADRTSVHLMDTAEIAMVEAAAGGLDDIRAAEVHVEVFDDALVASGKLDLGYILERTWVVVMKLAVFSFVRYAQDVVETATLRIERVQKFAEAEVALSTDDEVQT